MVLVRLAEPKPVGLAEVGVCGRRGQVCLTCTAPSPVSVHGPVAPLLVSSAPLEMEEEEEI